MTAAMTPAAQPRCHARRGRPIDECPKAGQFVVHLGEGLGEIVVTARKRDETLTNAPVAVTAIGGAELESQGVTGLEQLSARVPGLQVGRAAQTSNVFIRGVGSGINKGFSPASPGAAGDVDPEESLNYEYGVRYTSDNLSADVIGFFSDYDNLLGRCRVSDPNCNPGDEFNGGEVEIAGAEVTANYTHDLGDGLWLPVSFVYTYTETAFQETFYSNFAQWNPGFFDGVLLPVRQGDELPYTPDHQARLQIGLQGMRWHVNAALRYVSEMREVPGRGSYEDGEYTDEYTIIDLAANYDVTEDLSVQLVVENLTDEQEIVSRRPFGARPNLPQQVKVGVSYSF